MGDRSDGLLHQRLDRLEDKGRATLVGAARTAAWRGGIDLALRTAIVVPVLSLVAAMVRPLAVLPAIILSIVVPVVVLLVFIAVHMARFQVERRAALALVDQSLALKDRAVIAAEFLADDRQDGFRRAALQEALPWLDRAVSTPVEVEARGVGYGWRHWVMPVLALVILVAALTIRPSSSVAPGGAEPSALRRIAMAMGLRADDQEALADQNGGDAEGRSRDASAAAAGRGGAAGSQTGAVGAAVMARAGASPGGSAPALGQSLGGGRGASASSGNGGANNPGAAGRLADANSAPPSSRTADGPRGGESKLASDVQATAPESRATPPQGAQNGTGASASTPGGAPPAPRNPGGRQDQQRSGSRNRQQSGQQSQGSGSSGHADNNGQQGSNRGDGQEGAKRARGSSSLMLAVPMEDRVIGTVNAGAVSSTTRNAPPHAMASGMVAARSRGAGQGPGASLPERTRSVQEDLLLERYFARTGVGR